MISTKMACAGEGVMTTEMNYLQALQAAETWDTPPNPSLTAAASSASFTAAPTTEVS